VPKSGKQSALQSLLYAYTDRAFGCDLLSAIIKPDQPPWPSNQLIGALRRLLHLSNLPVYIQEAFLTQNIILIIGSNSGHAWSY
jgi:hypothetical protein